MDGTIRIRTAAWFATAIVLAVVCTVLVTQAWSADAAPGDSDSTFVPTAGCRIADTRPAPNTVGTRSTPLGAGDIFEVTVHGANGECTGPLAIPTDAVAVALNVTAVNATARSNIRIYPADLTEVPLLSNLNVTADAPPTPNKVDVKLSPDGSIKAFNSSGTVNIFIDIVGYYTNASLQELSQRVVALEAAQAAGVDPAVLARIDALEAAGVDPAVLARIDALETIVAGTPFNGGFETGDLRGWNQAGDNLGNFADVSVVAGLGSVTPTEGDHMALVRSPASPAVDFDFVFTNDFDWSSVDEVCFDIRVLFNGSPKFFGAEFFAAIASTSGEPILAAASSDSGGDGYSTVNFISGQEQRALPFLAGGDTGFDSMTAWETFCFITADVSFDGGDPFTPLSLSPTFGWSGTGLTDQAFLIDNVVGNNL